MSNHDFRAPTEREIQILNSLIDVGILQKGGIASQLLGAQVRTVDESGSIEFKVDPTLRAGDFEGPILSAMQADHDTINDYGPYIHYILFMKDGLITELQVYKDDGSPIQNPFDASRIEMVLLGKGNGPPRGSGEQ